MPSTRLAVLSLLLAARAFAYDVTSCFQVVPANDPGILQVDLDCPGDVSDLSAGPAVTIMPGGRLSLNGHSITGQNVHGIGSSEPSQRKITIVGPGEVFGFTQGSGIALEEPAAVFNMDIHDNAVGIQRFYDRTLRLKGVTVRNNASDGISYSFVPVIDGGEVTGTDVTITGNGSLGIRATGYLRFRHLTVTGNADGGVFSTSSEGSRLLDSTLTGNGSQGDVALYRAPRFTRSVCDHSATIDNPGVTLGICPGEERDR